MEKKAIFFSTDALIALIIILLTILIMYPVIHHSEFNSQLSEDAITTLSNLKTSEINNSYARELINNGEITDLNQSVLEQIGEFYAKDMPEAQLLASSIFSSLPNKGNIGIWMDNNLIFSTSSGADSSEELIASRQIISGIEKGKDIKGYSSRAFLSHANKEDYFYFGGYIGDGNITARMDYTGEIKDAKIEIAINKDFDLYINNIFSGHYENSSSTTTPAVYSISAYLINFHEGENEIKFVGNSLFIAGGYIKIAYDNSTSEQSSGIKYFPGIQGLINVYDSIYIPGNPSSLQVLLHLNSPYTVFLEIGNKTIFSNYTTGEQNITISSSQISSLLNYSSLNKKAIPIRLGLQNVSYISNLTKNVDVFSVSDLSGSMGDCAIQGTTSYCSYDCCKNSGTNCQTKSCPYTGTCSNQECGACTGSRPIARNYQITQQQSCNKTKLDLAKDSNNAFIDSILNYSGNRVGLTAYQTSYASSMSHPLSNNSMSLKNLVSSWSANGNTCICCGINEARNNLIANSTPDKLKVIVLMSDGQANVACSEQGTGNPKQDAINAACSAHAANITIYAVGFGSDADTATMQAIANCGGGSYYFGNVSEIVSVYQQIAQNIIQASYSEQTISSSGNISTTLFPDSYIEYQYTAPNVTYGLEATGEILFTNSTSGYFNIPQGAVISDARVLSYSGPRWTDYVGANNNLVYRLSDYGTDYTKLGDPYSIGIPAGFLGSNNTIVLTTGLAPGNSSEGSSSNKVIYTVIRPATGYSKISPSASGCLWTIEFEDSTNSTIPVPANYSGSNTCSYTSSSVSYNDNDAVNNAVYNLLTGLDLNSNHKVETKFSEQDLVVSSNEVSGIPYTWNSEVQVRVWR